MLRNYVITSLRRLYRQKGSTLINLAGLSLGIACALIVFQIIRFETGFDRFHAKADRIYRVVTEEHLNDAQTWSEGTPMPMADALRSDFPSLERVAGTTGAQSALFEVTRDDHTQHRFQQTDDVAFVEPEFFEIFDFPWLSGEPSRLAEPNTIALTESIARTYFGRTDVIGRSVRMDNKTVLTVVGVLRDFPTQTDFRFAVVVSRKTLLDLFPKMFSWRGISSPNNTWVLLPEGYPAANLERQLQAFKAKYYPDIIDPTRRAHFLQPLRDVHFDGRFNNYAQHTVAREILLALALLGAFVLVTACINFVNMATAQNLTRAREVGVRKVLGAVRSHLVGQCLVETLLLTVLSALVGIMLVEIVLSFVNELLGYRLALAPLSDPPLAGFLCLLVLVVGLSSGFYPALALSGFTPVAALKGQTGTGHGKKLTLRRVLIVIQFVISQVLIFGTIVLTSQLNFLHNRDLGIATEAIVMIDLPENDATTIETLKNRLMQDSRVHGVAFGFRSAVSNEVWDGPVVHTIHGAKEEYITDFKWGDADYASLYGLRFVAGRNYQQSDSVYEVVVNEAFARGLGVAPHDLIGKMIRLGGLAQEEERPLAPIVGVVKDFNERPLQDQIRPTLLACRRDAYGEAGIKIDTHEMTQTMAFIERCWSAAYPAFVFSSQFLDERIADFYKEEQRMSQILRTLTAIAIAIGMMGLFGLVSFMAARRTKEIGVRKVLGARTFDILLLFMKEFALLILVAFVVAAPVAYLIMNRWLEDFAYRISIGPEVFVLGILATALAVAISAGFRAVRASLANPVDTLRYE